MKLESAILNLECIIPVEPDLAEKMGLQKKEQDCFYNLHNICLTHPLIYLVVNHHC